MSTHGASSHSLRLSKAVKVMNEAMLRQFEKGVLEHDPIKAHEAGADSFLFHGTKEELVPNIQAEGLSMQFASPGMLGQGLYGAPDPRKSEKCVRSLPLPCAVRTTSSNWLPPPPASTPQRYNMGVAAGTLVLVEQGMASSCSSVVSTCQHAAGLSHQRVMLKIIRLTSSASMATHGSWCCGC